MTYINDSISGPIEYKYSDTGCAGGCAGGFADKVIKEITPQGSISYTYDSLGRRTSMTVAGQETVYYTYDANSRLINISSALQSQILNFGLSYDETGRRTSLTYPNGITTTYSYDNSSNLLELSHLSATQIIEKLTYQYDPNGNRTSMDRMSVAPKFPAPASNITYNSANQMLTFNDESLSYDLNGNLIQKGSTFYLWNARNQLVGINGPNLTALFKYDALGRRIEKTINGKTTNYLYDGLDIIQEIVNGMVSASYIRTLNIDEPLARVKADGTIRFYQQDVLGSVIALTDETGIIKTQYVYDPYGNASFTGEESDQPFQYTGRENDGTGLYYYRARYYSSELQRFISEDPIGFLGGVNFYKYVNNSPLVFLDPFGLWTYPTTGPVRGVDPHGRGNFGAPREGGRTHEGVDYSGQAGSNVYAPMGGTLELIENGVRITGRVNGKRYSTILTHINVTAIPGTILEGVVIGTVEDLTGRYRGITNHAHLELYLHINGTDYLRDPSDYIPPYSAAGVCSN